MNYVGSNTSTEEVIRCSLAPFIGVDTQPTPEVFYNLQLLAKNVIEPIKAIGQQVQIIRCYTPKEMAAVGYPVDEHMEGRAVDLRVQYWSLDNLARWLSCNVAFDEMYLEPADNPQWVHITTSENPRMNVRREA